MDSKIDYSASTPGRDILYLFILFEPLNIPNLLLVSKYYSTEIKKLLSEKHYWKEKALLLFREDQLKYIVEFKSLVLNRFYSKETLLFHLNNNTFISKNTSYLKFFNKNDYRLGTIGIEFSSDDVHELLINDKAEELFSKLSRFAKLIPQFYQNLKPEALLNDLEILQDNYWDWNSFKSVDTFFIALITPIMMLRATNCFNLFIRAYLNIYFATHHEVPKIFHDKLSTIIFASNDDYFIEKFISLIILVCQKGNPFIYSTIQLYNDKNYIHLVKKALIEIDEENLHIIEKKCLEFDVDQKYCTVLFPQSSYFMPYKNKLEATILTLQNILATTTPDRITLEVLQDQLNQALDNFKEVLPEKKTHGVVNKNYG